MKCHILDDHIFWGELQVGEVGKATVAPGELVAPSMPTCSYVLAPMPGGDVLFAGQPGIIGIERKAGTDFTSSYSSGHLAEQLAIMLACYDEVVLAIENTNLPTLCDNAGLGYLNVAQDIVTYESWGVIVVCSGSRPQTGQLVDKLYEYYQRPSHGAFYRRKLNRNLPFRSRVLAATPGWGKQTTDAALAVLQTPIEVVNAADDVLLSIPHITKRAVANLRAAWGRRTHEPTT